MTDAEIAAAVWNELTHTTDSYPTWVRKGRLSTSHWAKAKVLLDQIGQQPAFDPVGPSSLFQQLWDTTLVPSYSWTAPKVVTSQAQLDAALTSLPAGTRIQPREFVYRARLPFRGVRGPVWIDADPTFEIVDPVTGQYGQGLWPVDCQKLYVTGFPRIHHCGAQGLLDQGSKDCFYELDIRDNGGDACLANKATILTSGTTYKLRGGNNGLDLSQDPHPQKGTGLHFMNAWQLQGSLVLLDIDDQPYGAGLESCQLNGTRIAVRAKSLSCDVAKLPPAPDGSRQIGGNAWQPWDDVGIGPHLNCTVEAISVGSCAQGVAGDLTGTGNTGNVVKVGRVGSHRLSPTWAPLPGVTYLSDVA